MYDPPKAFQIYMCVKYSNTIFLNIKTKSTKNLCVCQTNLNCSLVCTPSLKPFWARPLQPLHLKARSVLKRHFQFYYLAFIGLSGQDLRKKAILTEGAAFVKGNMQCKWRADDQEVAKCHLQKRTET